MFFGAHWMCCYLDYRVASKCENPFQATWKCERWQREEEVDKAVTPSQPAVHGFAIKTIHQVSLSRLK